MIIEKLCVYLQYKIKKVRHTYKLYCIMKTLSKETKKLLSENAITYLFNEESEKFEIHYPSGNFDYLDSEEEVVSNVEEYVEFWDNLTK